MVQLIGSLIIILVLLIGYAVSEPQVLIVTYVSSFGFIALLSIIFALSIPLLVKLRRSNFTTTLLVNRRWIGIFTFFFALIHVLLVYNFFFGWDVAKIASQPNSLYLGIGTISFLLLAAMTATSNDAAARRLGRNWKRLHMVIYIVLVLILIHSFNLGLIFMRNPAVQAIVIGVGAVVLAIKLGCKVKKRSIVG